MSRKVPGVDELMRRISTSAQQAADSATTAALATLTRGGKILWSALPYPKAGTTSGPAGGHVGAVQPDGVTVFLDPLTGIISAGLLSGVKGDIFYIDADNKLALRHIGSPNDVLLVDPISGTPIWEPLADLAALINPLLPKVPDTDLTVSDSSAICLSLWNGSGNNAPPSGWEQRGFSEVGWHAPVDKGPETLRGGTVPYHDLWPEANAPSLTERALFRQHFTVPASPPLRTVTLFALGNQSLYGVWINGNLIPNSTGSTTGQGFSVFYTLNNVSISPSLFLPGADNVIALQGGDPEGLAVNQSAVTWNILGLF